MKLSLLLSLLLVLFVSRETQASDPGCTLDCHQNAPCVLGTADFSNHTLRDGGSLSFHEQAQLDGMHCACPHGWTGLLCNRKYETCDNEHKCYHGGECVPGLLDYFDNEQLFCDCSSAEDSEGNDYVGKYCEHAAVDYCGGSDERFCVNQGTCNPGYP